MRKAFSWVFVILPLTILLSSALGGETQFLGKNWFRYTQKMKDSKTEESEFAVERIYFRWNHKHTDNLESRGI